MVAESEQKSWKASGLVAMLFTIALSILVYELLPESRTLDPVSMPLGEQVEGCIRVEGQYAALDVSFVDRGGNLYGFSDHHLFRSRDGGTTFARIGTLPKTDSSVVAKARDRIARTKLVRRLRGPNAVPTIVVLRSGTILAFYDHTYRSNDGGETFEAVFDFHDNGPFSRQVGLGPDDSVYVGEYRVDKRPHEVRIFGSRDDGRTWRVAYTFPKGEIFHVHSVTYDPYGHQFLVATGDENQESWLYATNDHFATLHRIGGGTQDWRIVALIPREDAIYWGSDDDRSGAKIFRFDRKTRKLEEQQFIGTPSYYATQTSDGRMFLTTAFEPRSEFTRRSSPQRRTDLWESLEGRTWRRVMSLNAMATANGSARAQMLLPAGYPAPKLYVAPLFTAAPDNMTFRLASCAD